MLKWLRGRRLDMKTTVIVIAIALLAWAMVVYVNVRDFVPEELAEERDTR